MGSVVRFDKVGTFLRQSAIDQSRLLMSLYSP